MSNLQRSVDLAILRTVRLLSEGPSRRVTCGQIYLELARFNPHLPPVAHCAVAVDVLVREGLLVSERVLGEDPGFPYPQHLIIGLSEMGAASLDALE